MKNKNSIFILMILIVTLVNACNGNAVATTAVVDEVATSTVVNETEEAGVLADLVFINGTIYTVNSEQPWAEAVAVKDKKIIFVGSTEEAELYIGDQTQLIDLAGKMMLPGIHDVHTHPLEAGSSVGGTCILSADIDPEEMVDLIKECAPNQIGTDWVLGWGHSIDQLLNSERPPIQILDEAIPDHPAIMMEQTSHSVWVNSMALAAAGIDENSPNPPGGIILKDSETGKPNGILMENAGDILFEMALTPTPKLEQLHYEGLLYSLDQLAQNGITSVVDARVYWGRNYHKVWLRAEQEGKLTARTILGLWAYPQLDDDEQLATLTSLYSNDPEWLLRISQIKLYSDGLLENTTAAMLEPYLFDLEIIPDNRGMNYFDEERLTRYVTTLEDVGFDMHIHTIGDRAVQEALNAIESAMEINGEELDRRHRLTHLEHIAEADILRFQELGVIADFQVAGDWTLPEFWADSEELIGELAFDPIPVRSIYDTGATITLSSDWDVSELSPFIGMSHALMRDQQSLPNLETVIETYTINAAYVMRQEDQTGSIEVGKFADLIVIDQNLFEISPEQIQDTTVLLTIFGGEEIYRSSSFLDKP